MSRAARLNLSHKCISQRPVKACSPKTSAHLSYSAISPALNARFHPSCQSRPQSNPAAELGLRSILPPDSSPEPPFMNKDNQVVSEQEWGLRTGRAIHILTHTLPTFFSTGLVTTGTDTSNTQSQSPTSMDQIDIDSIYSPDIHLSYTPPVALPAPFPQTLHIEGLPLYMASSVFVRHTLNALYSDLHVELRRVEVQTPSLSARTQTSGTHANTVRDKSVFIGLCVNGIARVSGGVGEWEVDSTYTFSPNTGLIYLHRVEAIRPEPHQAVYDALRASLVNVFGLGHKGASAAYDGTGRRIHS